MSDRVLLFMLAEQRFALPVQSVRECLPLPLLSRRPGLPAHVAGFFALGSVMLPVLDLARLLGLRDDDATPLLEANGLYRHLIRLDAVTLLVDRVTDLAERVPAPTEAGADRWQHGCVAGRLLVEGKPAVLLDPDRILLQDERARLEALAASARTRSSGWDPEDGDDV